MGYTNSGLVNYIVKSPNHSGQRICSIDTITPHCVVGQLSAQAIGNCFGAGKNASCNYGIGTDGKVVLVVDEANRSWCSSNRANDQRAVTIECASDTTEPYTMNSTVYKKLVKLCVDICKRNGKTKLLWFGDKDKTLKYTPKQNEMVITVHRWFAAKACPGDWLYSRLGDLADRVTKELSGTPTTSTRQTIYRVQVGAFTNKKNARSLLSEVKKKGFDAIINTSGKTYTVQVGAFTNKDNAKAMLQRLKSVGYEGFLVTNKKNTSIPTKSVYDVAMEVIKGTCSDERWSTWGAGDVRVQRLTAAGYNASAVQAQVNAILKHN